MSDSKKRRSQSANAVTPSRQPSPSSTDDFLNPPLYRPEDAAGLHVYQYHHLDDLSFARRPNEVFQNLNPGDLKRLLEAVKERFRTAGWEGDGTLQLIWLPPFVDAGIEDTWGNYLWHVKQENNGTSWIGSKNALDFGRRADQNEHFPYETHVRVSIVYDAALTLIRDVEAKLNCLRNRIDTLNTLNDSHAAGIANELRIAAQGELTTELQVFLDDCYLQILTDVLERGNRSNLRLAKFKVNMDPSSYELVDDIQLRDRERDDIQKWLTLKGVVHDIWASFTFEPFDLKMKPLFRACDYKDDDGNVREVTKHVHLRNCVQHHQRKVTADALQRAGLQSFSLLNERNKAMNLAVGDSITFSLAELESFGRSLVKLAAGFDHHVVRRVKSSVWAPREKLPILKGDKS
jgi:hypothetical protein